MIGNNSQDYSLDEAVLNLINAYEWHMENPVKNDISLVFECIEELKEFYAYD